MLVPLLTNSNESVHFAWFMLKRVPSFCTGLYCLLLWLAIFLHISLCCCPKSRVCHTDANLWLQHCGLVLDNLFVRHRRFQRVIICRSHSCFIAVCLDVQPPHLWIALAYTCCCLCCCLDCISSLSVALVAFICIFMCRRGAYCTIGPCSVLYVTTVLYE